MKRIFQWIVVIAISAITVIGCASDGVKANGPSEAAPGEKLIWQSDSHGRPKWTNVVPEPEGSYWFYSAISRYYADEEGSRSDAVRAVTDKVIKEMGTLAKNKFTSASVSSGLRSDIVNPTEIANELKVQMAAGNVKGLKAIDYYTEKWQLPTGIGYKTFVLARVPKASLDSSLAAEIDKQLAETQKKQKNANDETSKNQLDKYAENLKKMKEIGVMPEDRDAKE